jgi:hypothetical protein
LEWDFDEKLSNDKLNFLSIDPNAINAETAIRPGSAWTDLLTSSNFVQFVMSLQPIFMGDAKCLRFFIKLFTQMASLSGTIFADKAAELVHMLQICSGKIPCYAVIISRSSADTCLIAQEFVAYRNRFDSASALRMARIS